MALSWGIAGTGRLCDDFVKVLNFLPSEEHKVSAVADNDRESAEDFSRRNNIPIAYGCYEALIADESIDVVYVASVSDVHFLICKMVLTSKKHLVCEKPVCIKFEDTNDLVVLAQENKVFFMESIWSRFFPVYDELRKLLSSNSIGDALYLRADYGVPLSFRDKIRNKELRGGTIFDLGVYVLQLALLVFGRTPESIAAVGHVNENGLDESIHYVLKYKGGKIASFCTHSLIKMNNSAVIYGTGGSIKINEPFWAPTEIIVNDAEPTTFPLPVIEGEKHFSRTEGLLYEAMEVRDCIIKGLLESPKMSHDDTLTITKMQEKISKYIGSSY